MFPFPPPPGFVVPAPTPVENFVSLLVLMLCAIFLGSTLLPRRWFLILMKVAFPFLLLTVVTHAEPVGKYTGVACRGTETIYAESVEFVADRMRITAIQKKGGQPQKVDTVLTGKLIYERWYFTKPKEDGKPSLYVLRETLLGSKVMVAVVNYPDGSVLSEVLWKETEGYPLAHYLDEKQSQSCKSLAEGYLK